MAYEVKHVPITQAAYSDYDIRPPAGEAWVIHSIAGYPGYMTLYGMPGVLRLGNDNNTYTLGNGFIGAWDDRSILSPTGGTDLYAENANYLRLHTYSPSAVNYVLLAEKVNKPDDEETWRVAFGNMGGYVSVDLRPAAGKAFVLRGFGGHMMYCSIRPRTATTVATGDGFGTGTGPGMRPKGRTGLYANNSVYFQIYNRDSTSQAYHLTYVEVEEPADMNAVAFDQAVGTVEVRPPVGEQWIVMAAYSGNNTQAYQWQFTMDGTTYHPVGSMGIVPRLQVPITNAGWMKVANNSVGGMKWLSYVKVS